ncbi:MAG: sugar ABC transporter ATP-binding protein [Candidatus Neomarinimicrobiota bacterium]|mgnify:CR=1 FL=1|nr:MAG: sugar ABC transporter ATP-binding protein [Candidatus Neomarinimicrobiota bacterium]
MATIELRNITKEFEKNKPIIENLNLSIFEGEFLVLVGPSGCGKSTTLRMIAGLEEVTQGDIFIDDQLINYVAPKNRDIAMVFQNYALYPHMTVYENMSFGLRLRKYSKEAVKERVNEAASILELEDLLNRKPKQLSGGQRQRVALGRAIVRKPKVFLFDEPLSNLDAKLRIQMRAEIKKLHQKLKTTMVYVTHDQVEAMTMGDRIVVMKDGVIHQIGSPSEIYQKPDDLFVAGFIGSPVMNFLLGSLNKNMFISGDSSVKLNLLEHTVDKAKGKSVVLGIRPEDVSLSRNSKDDSEIRMKLEMVEPMGNETILTFTCGQNKITCRSYQGDIHYESGSVVKVYFNLNKIHLFDNRTGKVINKNVS